MQNLCILGSTGSIGTSTLDVLRQNQHQYGVYALVAGHNIDLLCKQIQEFKPKIAVVETAAGVDAMQASLAQSGMPRASWPELLWGAPARVEVATAGEVDVVISAIVGVAGLEATYEAVRAGKRVALANKEVLVSAGKLVMDAVAAA